MFATSVDRKVNKKFWRGGDITQKFFQSVGMDGFGNF